MPTTQYTLEQTERGYSLLTPEIDIHFQANLFERLKTPSRCILLGLLAEGEARDLSVMSLRVLVGETADELNNEMRRVEITRLNPGTGRYLEIVGLFSRRPSDESNFSPVEVQFLREHFAKRLFILLTQKMEEPDRFYLQCFENAQQQFVASLEVPSRNVPDLNPAPVAESLAALSKAAEEVDLTKVVRRRRWWWF